MNCPLLNCRLDTGSNTIRTAARQRSRSLPGRCCRDVEELADSVAGEMVGIGDVDCLAEPVGAGLEPQVAGKFGAVPKRVVPRSRLCACEPRGSGTTRHDRGCAVQSRTRGWSLSLSSFPLSRMRSRAVNDMSGVGHAVGKSRDWTHQVPSSVLTSALGGPFARFCARPTASTPARMTLLTPATPLRFKIARLMALLRARPPPATAPAVCMGHNGGRRPCGPWSAAEAC